MQKVILPFALAPTKNGTAVSESTFTVNAAQGQFRTLNVMRMHFMKIYEDQHYDLTQYPFQSGFHEWKTYTDAQRVLASTAPTPAANSIQFGHPWNVELGALDVLPQWLELKIIHHSSRVDKINLKTGVVQDRQSTNTKRLILKEDNTKIQTLLHYNPTLLNYKTGGYQGFVSCNMTQLGFVDVEGQGNGNTFTIQASMYDFKNQGISTIPPIQLSILFA